MTETTLYLLPPCSDTGPGRLWCEDARDCGEICGGPYPDCEFCNGEGIGPVKYIRADAQQGPAVPEAVRELLRDLQVWLQGDHYRFSDDTNESESWKTMISRIDRALAQHIEPENDNE